MRAWTILLALTVAPFAAAAQDSDGPELAYGGTGRAAHYFYTQVFADCEKLTHSFGRNTAWKGWHLPMARISTGEVHADGAAALVRFDCLDGSTCIAHSQPAARPADDGGFLAFEVEGSGHGVFVGLQVGKGACLLYQLANSERSERYHLIESAATAAWRRS